MTTFENRRLKECLKERKKNLFLGLLMLAGAGAYFSLTPDQKLNQESLRVEFRKNAVWVQVMEQSREQIKPVADAFANSSVPASRATAVNIPVLISINEEQAYKRAEISLQTRLSTERFFTASGKALTFTLLVAGLAFLGACGYSHRQVQSIRRDMQQGPA